MSALSRATTVPLIPPITMPQTLRSSSAACCLARLGVLALVAAFALDLTAAEFFNVFMAGCGLVGVGLLAALSVRCRVCSEFVMFNLWREGYWLRMHPLESVRVCPNCGATSNEESIV